MVFHVHDEVVVYAGTRGPDAALADVCRIMAVPMDWAPDLPLRADGWTDRYYKKD